MNAINYFDTQLCLDFKSGLYNYSKLLYDIEYDRGNVSWKLSIISTPESEEQGSEEGILLEYQYFAPGEAQSDIVQLQEDTHILFDKA